MIPNTAGFCQSPDSVIGCPPLQVVETAKSSATKLSAAERALVEGLVGEAEEAMQGYEACIHGPTPTQHAIKKQQGNYTGRFNKKALLYIMLF